MKETRRTPSRWEGSKNQESKICKICGLKVFENQIINEVCIYCEHIPINKVDDSQALQEDKRENINQFKEEEL